MLTGFCNTQRGLRCPSGFAMPLGSTRPMALSSFTRFPTPALRIVRAPGVCVSYKYPAKQGCSGDRDARMFVAAFQLLGLPRKVWFSGTGRLVNLCLFPTCHSRAAPGGTGNWAAWTQTGCFSGYKPTFGPNLCYFSFSLKDLIHHPLSRSSIQST